MASQRAFVWLGMWSLLAASSGIFADAGSGTTADLAEGEVLLQEDFSDPSSESFVSGAFPEGYEMGSVGGAYRIAVNNARLGAVSSIGHERMESLRLELEATEVTGGSADFVGVRCYTDLESNEGYAVGVNPAARGYRVDAFNRDDFRLLESSDAPADAVRRLGDENHMQVVCDSSSNGPTVVTLAVNGQMLVRAEDGRGSRGGFDGIGLFVQTAEDSAAAEALFDDMTLTGVGADRAAREWLRILGIAAAVGLTVVVVVWWLRRRSKEPPGEDPVQMDVPPGYVRIYRKTFGLLLEAELPADAERGFSALVGDHVIADEYRVFFEHVEGVEGEVIDPASNEREGLPLYPGRATMVVMTDSLERAEAIFASLDGSVTADETDREVTLEVTDGPAETGLMPIDLFVAPLAPIRTIVISRSARNFIVRNGGSAYVWTKPFGGGYGTLTASTTRPDGVDFELPTVLDDDGVCVFVEEGLALWPVSLKLRRFPSPTLVARGKSWGDTAL